MAEPGDVSGDSEIPVDHLAAIGEVANAWAVLEFQIDLTIWWLMDTPQMVAACVTAQLMSIHPRLRALQALVNLRGGSRELGTQIASFAGELGGLVESRNRAVHDPRMAMVMKDAVQRLNIPAQRRIKFGFVDETVPDLKKTHDSIKRQIRRFNLLHKKIVAEIQALPPERRPPLHKILRVDPDPVGRAS